MFEIIVAHDEANHIGYENRLPWTIKDDLNHFRKLTTENGPNLLIMGKNTFFSLPPLKGNRDIAVLTSTEFATQDNVWTCSSVSQIMDVLQSKRYSKHFIIGGQQIYKLFLEKHMELIDKIHITFLHQHFVGDTYFPVVHLNKFYISTFEKRLCRDELSGKDVDLDFMTLLPKPDLGEVQYLNLVQTLLAEGEIMNDRTNTGVQTLFGKTMEFDLQYGFPLLTSKKVFFRGVVEELLWFLSGKTDASLLSKKGVNIWNDNTTREFLDEKGLTHRRPGDGGPIYGFQFRHFGDQYKDCDSTYQGFDQIAYVLHLLKTEPTSRRMVINLWDGSKLNEMVLPPCHMTYHFKVEHGRLSCILYQRSGDIGLGVPFNIASASLFLSIMSKLSKFPVGRFIHFLGDVHLYQNHVTALQEQLTHETLYFPKLDIQDRGQKTVDDFLATDFKILGYRGKQVVPMKMAV